VFFFFLEFFGSGGLTCNKVGGDRPRPCLWVHRDELPSATLPAEQQPLPHRGVPLCVCAGGEAHRVAVCLGVAAAEARAGAARGQEAEAVSQGRGISRPRALEVPSR
jgi:hypothetical protein